MATRYYRFDGITVAVRTGQGMGAVTSLIPDADGTTIAAIPNTDYAAGAVRRIYTTPSGSHAAPPATAPGPASWGCVYRRNGRVCIRPGSFAS